ncbi:MAG TPA: amidohydrolase family protein [Acidimicrobiia bacterium]|nr:amidohydrolase family protein [Acidimicrobiia bacterium]
MGSSELPAFEYALADADNHYYEPDDCFTRHIAPAYREQAVKVVRTGDDGYGRVLIGDQPGHFMRVSPGDHVGPPGHLQAYFRGEVERGHVTDAAIDAKDYPEFMEREARLKLMDAQGLETAVLIPTFGLAVEEDLHEDFAPDVTYANLESFNRWLAEDWGYGADGRIIGVPVLSLLDADLAVAELDRVLAEGARMVHLRPGPVYGRSPADPAFDAFWSRVEEAGVPVAFHISDSQYPGLFSTHWGEYGRPAVHRLSPFQRLTCFAERPIVDTLAALVLHNLFGRHPGVQVISIENGSEWVPHLLKMMDKAAGSVQDRDWPFGVAPAKPSEVFKSHVSVVPFHEEDIPGLIGLLGPEKVVFGSDFPHPEGLAEPVEFATALEGQSPEVVRQVMRDNLRDLLRLGS